VANALGELTKISACYSRGEISYSKVRAMTRVATVDNEDYLLMIAQHGTAYHVETLVRKYRRVMRLADDAGKQHDERSLRVCYEPDGTIVLHARLPAEKGALVLAAPLRFRVSARGNLETDSDVMLDQTRTIDNKRMTSDLIATLTERELTLVEEYWKIVLGLAD
jgi:mRNA-degrading endonuclease toxin of MazEF toxin-antitoxin module